MLDSLNPDESLTAAEQIAFNELALEVEAQDSALADALRPPTPPPNQSRVPLVVLVAVFVASGLLLTLIGLVAGPTAATVALFILLASANVCILLHKLASPTKHS